MLDHLSVCPFVRCKPIQLIARKTCERMRQVTIIKGKQCKESYFLLSTYLSLSLSLSLSHTHTHTHHTHTISFFSFTIAHTISLFLSLSHTHTFIKEFPDSLFPLPLSHCISVFLSLLRIEQFVLYIFQLVNPFFPFFGEEPLKLLIAKTF